MSAYRNKLISVKAIMIFYLVLAIMLREILSDSVKSDYDISATIIERMLDKLLPIQKFNTPKNKVKFEVNALSDNLSKLKTNNFEGSFLPISIYENPDNLGYFLNYFLIKANVKGFTLKFITTNTDFDLSSDENIKMIGIVNNIEEENLYIVFLDYTNSINLFKCKYKIEANNLTNFPVSNLNLDFQFDTTQNRRPVIVQANNFSLIILDNGNNFYIYVSSLTKKGINEYRNIKLHTDDFISPSECFLYKIVDLNSFFTEDNKYVIIGMVYYCADLSNGEVKMEIKFSNLFIEVNLNKLNHQNPNAKPKFKFKNIYSNKSDPAQPNIDIQNLGQLKMIFNQIKPNKKLSSITSVENQNFFFINLENKIQIFQKFFYDKRLEDTFYHVFPHENLFCLQHSIFSFTQKDMLSLYLKNGRIKIKVKKLEELFNLGNKINHDESNSYSFQLPFTSNIDYTSDLEIKEMKTQFMIYNKKNISESVFINKDYKVIE